MEGIPAMDQGKHVISPPPLEEEWQRQLCDELTIAPVPCPPALQGGGGRELGSEAEPGEDGKDGGLKYILYHLCRHKTHIAAELVFEWCFFYFFF